MNPWTKSISILAATFVVAASSAGCGTTKGAHPDDMTHAEHLAAAQAEQKEAEEARLLVDPTRVTGGTGQAEVAAHERHAAAHAAAAQALEERHEAVCADVSDQEMRSCPLHSIDVTAVIDRADGVELVLGALPEAHTLLESSRCHAAHGAYFGRDMPDCVFYVKELHVGVEERNAGTVLILTSTNPDAVVELKQRAQSLLPGPVDPELYVPL